MTAEEARRIAKTNQSRPITDAFAVIEPATRRGAYKCHMDGLLSDEAVAELESLGFTVEPKMLVTDSTNVTRISWEVVE